MNHRTLSLLATPAVVGAMAVAVPALGLTSAQPVASSARHCRVVVVISHGQRHHACLLRGPRGLQGLPGGAGPRGATGAKGPRGATASRGPIGPQGPAGTQGTAGGPGTARAYAVVQPTIAPATTPSLVAAQSSNVTAVSEAKEGVYCLTPAAGINPAGDTAVVSPEVSYGAPGKGPGTIALNAQSSDCPAGTFEVETYEPAGAKLAGGYAFSVIVP